MGRRKCSLARAVLIVVGSMGCGEGGGSDASDRDGLVVRDSAGVRIVESTGPQWSPSRGWRLAPAPTVRIGDSEDIPAEQFTRIPSLYRLPGGRIVVTNANNPPEIRIFDAGGRHVRSLGGSGDGPGEFRNIMWSAPAGRDSVVAYSGFAHRLTYFAWDGNLLATRDLAGLRDPSRGLANLLFARFGDGTFLRFPNRAFDATLEGHRRDSTPWTLAGADGAIIDTLGRFPGFEYVSSGPRDATAVLLGLRFVVHGQGDRVYVGAGDAFRIDVYDLSGAQLASMRRSVERVPVSEAHKVAAEERALADAPEAAHAAIRRRYLEAPWAEVLPAHGNNILVDSDANVWVEEYLVPTDSVPHWSVFDSTGVFLGSVTMPVRFRPFDIGSDYVLGVWRDELNVEQVLLYPLIKGPLG